MKTTPSPPRHLTKYLLHSNAVTTEVNCVIARSLYESPCLVTIYADLETRCSGWSWCRCCSAAGGNAKPLDRLEWLALILYWLVLIARRDRNKLLASTSDQRRQETCTRCVQLSPGEELICPYLFNVNPPELSHDVRWCTCFLIVRKRWWSVS